MTTTSINAADVKEDFSELLNKVVSHKEHFILTRRGKEIAAIIPYHDWLILQELQSKNDLDAAVEALKEARNQGTISFEDLKKK